MSRGKPTRMCKECARKASATYRRTPIGLTVEMYKHQKQSSKRRRMAPPAYSRSWFTNWVTTQPNFNKLYEAWKVSGYKKELVPSVDRLDDNKPYAPDNIQLMTWGENKKKGSRCYRDGKIGKQVDQLDLNGNLIKTWSNIVSAAEHIGCDPYGISKVCQGKQLTCKKFKWRYHPMAIRFRNDENYGLSIAVWLSDDDYADDMPEVTGPYISVTSLIKPLRMIVLDQRAKEAKAKSGETEIINLSRFVPSRLGTAIHSAIEHSWTRITPQGEPAYKIAMRRLGYPEHLIDKIRINPTEEEQETVEGIIPVWMEQRTTRQVGRWTIGGKFDFIGNGNLEDFKSMGVFGYRKGDKDEEQMMQGSLYRWLNPDLVTSNTMKVQQIFTDWSKMDAMKYGNSTQGGKFKLPYPPARILEKSLALQKMDEWVHHRIDMIDGLMDKPEELLPMCTQKELWQDPPKWKYYKNPGDVAAGKRSTRNFDTYGEAHARFMKDGEVGCIVEAPNPIKRCNYCGGYDLCKQKDAYLNSGVLVPLL